MITKAKGEGCGRYRIKWREYCIGTDIVHYTECFSSTDLSEGACLKLVDLKLLMVMD